MCLSATKLIVCKCFLKDLDTLPTPRYSKDVGIDYSMGWNFLGTTMGRSKNSQVKVTSKSFKKFREPYAKEAGDYISCV
jgi:hypothetical protein